uniref:Olfactory receptor n=1 Tax=Chelonoidis abingdonii TaxID=106734 RepID=A0A8C0G1D1_CHEAB
MKMKNQTTVTEFILLGLSSDPQMQILLFLISLFLVFLVVYLITLLANMMIMLVIRADPHLHTPMYFFLSHLSFVDICYSTVPKTLVHFLENAASQLVESNITPLKETGLHQYMLAEDLALANKVMIQKP